jgi:hypothetical protein
MSLKEPLLSGDSPLEQQPQQVQKKVSPFDDITARIEMIDPNEMQHSHMIGLLFGTFTRIALALGNETLTESEANLLYQSISEINIGSGSASRANLTLAQVKELANIFKEASEGTSRDIDLLTLELINQQKKRETLVNKINSVGENTMLSLDRIFDSEKAVAAMMRLCKTLAQLNIDSAKCKMFHDRLQLKTLQTNKPINMDSVYKMSEQEINLNKMEMDDFTYIIDEINRQEHESNVRKTRPMFHKGGRGNSNIQKKQSRTKKSKYNKPKCNKKNIKTQNKYCKK